MKRILFLLPSSTLLTIGSATLTMTAYGQPFLTNLSNFRTFNAGYGALTGTSVIHPPMVFGNVDSVCNYLAQLYALIGTAGNLQAVTAAGNSTTIGMYTGTGLYATPNTGVVIDQSVKTFKDGVNTGGVQNNGLVYPGTTLFYSKDPSSAFYGSFAAGSLTGNRVATMPDEGNGVGIGSSVVLHKTQYPDTIGDPSILGTTQTNLGYWAWQTGIPYLYAGNDGSGTPEFFLYNSGGGGNTTIKPTSSSGTFAQFFPPENGTFAMKSDTAGGAGVFLTVTSGVTPTGAITLTNKRWVPRHHDTASWATPLINTDLYEDYSFTAQTANITSVTFSGTPNEGQTMCLHFKGTGTRTITGWSGINASTIPLPSTTVGTAVLNVSFIYTNGAWYVMGTW